jgi:predicted CopG family antitoxin
MRTIITIDDRVYQGLKAWAETSNESISKFIEDAVVNQVLGGIENL